MADDNTANEAEALPTQEVTVAGMTFLADMPYKVGDVITAGEASALNQTYSENLRNNFAGRVKKAKEAALTDAKKAWVEAGSQGAEPTEATLNDKVVNDLRNAWDEYASTYEFNGRRVARQQGDPIEREARKLAWQMIAAHCKEASPPIDTKTFTDDKKDELIIQVLDKYPDVREAARSRIEAMKSVVNKDINFAA